MIPGAEKRTRPWRGSSSLTGSGQGCPRTWAVTCAHTLSHSSPVQCLLCHMPLPSTCSSSLVPSSSQCPSQVYREPEESVQRPCEPRHTMRFGSNEALCLFRERTEPFLSSASRKAGATVSCLPHQPLGGQKCPQHRSVLLVPHKSAHIIFHFSCSCKVWTGAEVQGKEPPSQQQAGRLDRAAWPGHQHRVPFSAPGLIFWSEGLPRR